MAERRYDPREIEPRWQELWANERTWQVANEGVARARGSSPAGIAGGDSNSYVLEMLPYPSGEPHIAVAESDDTRDRKSTRLNSSHSKQYRMPSSA